MSYTRKGEIKRVLDKFEAEMVLDVIATGGTLVWADLRKRLEKEFDRFGKKERNEVHRQRIAETTERLEATPVVLPPPFTRDFDGIERMLLPEELTNGRTLMRYPADLADPDDEDSKAICARAFPLLSSPTVLPGFVVFAKAYEVADKEGLTHIYQLVRYVKSGMVHYWLRGAKA